ncbi:MAG: hypothetical protein R3C59_07005 [Planctomycetaceae bacterium]
MHRRNFLSKALSLGTGLAGSTLIPTGMQAGLFEDLLIGVDQTRGTLLDHVDVVMRNARIAFRGFYHGYGLGMKQILEETQEPLPTTPKRNHPGWPHVHCVCHCNAVANLGAEEGVELSRMGGLSDEISQTFFARLFYDVVLPLTWNETVLKFSDRGDEGKAVREMKFIMNYSFGDAKVSEKAIKLATFSDRDNRETLTAYKDMIYGLIDALESAWQKSDFNDNAIGRQGGLNCPKGASAQKRREWCSGWCTQKGVPTNVAEGPGTKRPWGPFHPLYPGPMPTHHDTLHGQLIPLTDAALSGPPPEMVPIKRPDLPGMYELPVNVNLTG